MQDLVSLLSRDLAELLLRLHGISQLCFAVQILIFQRLLLYVNSMQRPLRLFFFGNLVFLHSISASKAQAASYQGLLLHCIPLVYSPFSYVCILIFYYIYMYMSVRYLTIGSALGNHFRCFPLKFLGTAQVSSGLRHSRSFTCTLEMYSEIKPSLFLLQVMLGEGSLRQVCFTY